MSRQWGTSYQSAGSSGWSCSWKKLLLVLRVITIVPQLPSRHQVQDMKDALGLSSSRTESKAHACFKDSRVRDKTERDQILWPTIKLSSSWAQAVKYWQAHMIVPSVSFAKYVMMMQGRLFSAQLSTLRAAHSLCIFAIELTICMRETSLPALR